MDRKASPGNVGSTQSALNPRKRSLDEVETTQQQQKGQLHKDSRQCKQLGDSLISHLCDLESYTDSLHFSILSEHDRDLLLKLQTASATPHLLAEVQQRMKEDPMTIMSRTFNILSASESDTALRTVCHQTLRTVLPVLLVGSYHNQLVDTILTCLERHLWSLTVQLEAGKILLRLLTENNKNSADSNKGDEKPYTARCLSVIFQSMLRHSNDITLQCLLFDLIRRFKHDSFKQSDWIDGAYAILNSLKAHPTAAYIQRIGLSLIAWLAEDALCRKTFVQRGGVLVIPPIMELHMSDALIQCKAAASLCFLVHVEGQQGRGRLDPKHIPTILQVMDLHQDNPSVFGNCVCLLCGLQDVRTDTPAVLNLVISGMQRNESSAKVQESCLRWIRFRDPAQFEHELKAAIPTILKAIRLHPTNAHLQEQAADVLTVLVGLESLRETLLEQGAVDIMLEMLSTRRSDRRVKLGAVWFLTLAMSVTPTTMAFGGDFNVLETIWQSLGIDEDTEHEGIFPRQQMGTDQDTNENDFESDGDVSD